MPPVLLVRHALSEWNVDGRWQGQADPPLSPAGRAQAEAAASGVGPVDLVITSDLERAYRTGALLAPGVRHRIEPLLREFDVGLWSGLTRAQIEQRWPTELAAFEAGSRTAPPGGEDRSVFDRRVLAAAGRVAELVAQTGAAPPTGPGSAAGSGSAANGKSETRPGGIRTLVVSHGGVVRALARLLAQLEGHVGHLCGYEAAVDGAALSLLRPVNLLDGAGRADPKGDRMAL
jgi:broad specificity phosphatase PhoE